MPLSNTCRALIAATAGLAMSACGGSVPPTSLGVADSVLTPVSSCVALQIARPSLRS